MEVGRGNRIIMLEPKAIFDPRTKLVLTLIYTVWVVVLHHLVWLGMTFGVLLLLLVTLGHIRAYGRWLLLVVPMSLFFGAVVWWSAGRDAAVFAALKLLTLTSTFFVFFSTTVPEDLANSLVKIGLPYPVAFVLNTALQFVPVMARRAKNVLDAQRARGIDLQPGWSALRNYPAFFGPILIQAFQFAEELAEAMETRGFGLPGRTFLKDYRMKLIDWIAIIVGVLLVTILMIFIT